MEVVTNFFEKKNIVPVIFPLIDFFLISFLAFILCISKGIEAGVFFFIISASLYTIFQINLNVPRLFVIPLLCIVAVSQSMCIPKGTFLYTNQNVEYLAESGGFISPFVHDKPFVKGPDPESGELQIKNAPKNWHVQLAYTIHEPSSVKIDDWFTLQQIVKDGVEVPVHLFDVPSNQQKHIEGYLNTTYPFFTTNAVVQYRDQ
jgi:hypothetical protein